jgi:hypothetical protein
VFQTYVSVVLFVFRRMLQMFHLTVFKVDQVLYMLQYDSPATTACCSYWGAVHACGQGMERCAAAGAGNGG